MRIRRLGSSVTLMALAFSLVSVEAKAQTCDDNSGNSPWVCVDWSQQNDPIQGQDFFFDFQTDPDNPGVQLRAGDSGWVVWSQVSSGNSTPASLGEVTIDPSSSTENFQVKIANGSGAGAANVAKFDLTAGGGWSGYSNITGGSITGNLTGDLKVKKSGTSGGGITFSIGGNMTGNIDVDHIAAGGLTITGDFGSTSVRRSITIGEIKEGNLSIGDLIEAAINVTTLDGKTIQIAESADATLIANRSAINVTNASGAATIKVGYALGSRADSNVNIIVNSAFPADGLIDLTHILLEGGVYIGGMREHCAGDVTLGALADSGVVIFYSLSGTLDVKGGTADGSHIDFDGDLTGSILINSNRENDAEFGSDINCLGQIGSSGLIHIYADGEGEGGHFRSGNHMYFSHATTGCVGQIIIEGDCAGGIFFYYAFGSILSPNGLVDIRGALASSGKVHVGRGEGGNLFGGNMTGGTIKIGGNAAGSIEVRDNNSGKGNIGSTGLIRIGAGANGGKLTGTIRVDDDCAGDIEILNGAPLNQDVTGTLDLLGALSGDLYVEGDINNAGEIDVERLTSTGRILIDGLCDGDVLVQDDTVANSLIRMTEGLDDNGLIKINASEGAYDAKGDIHIGPDDPTSTDPVVFDGSIFVKDQSGTGNEGDLDGDITVNGCHATAADLNICIEGSINGQIAIHQTGCTNQVTHSCTP